MWVWVRVTGINKILSCAFISYALINLATQSFSLTLQFLQSSRLKSIKVDQSGQPALLESF